MLESLTALPARPAELPVQAAQFADPGVVLGAVVVVQPVRIQPAANVVPPGFS
jgi:hypothetical protein